MPTHSHLLSPIEKLHSHLSYRYPFIYYPHIQPSVNMDAELLSTISCLNNYADLAREVSIKIQTLEERTHALRAGLEELKDSQGMGTVELEEKLKETEQKVGVGLGL